MKKLILNVSQYKVLNRLCPRLAVISGNIGKRIVGAKFSDFNSKIEFDIELDDEQRKELIKVLMDCE